LLSDDGLLWLHRKKNAFVAIIKTAHAPVLLGSQAQTHHDQPEEKNLYHYHQNRVASEDLGHYNSPMKAKDDKRIIPCHLIASILFLTPQQQQY